MGSLTTTSLAPSLALSANGCSAPSTLAIKEESKGDIRLLYSLAPPEGRLAEGTREEAVKSEGGEEKEREKGWVLGDARGLGDRGGSEQAHGLLWVPKERMGPERGAERGGGGGSPSPLFSSPLSLSFVPSNHEATQQKRGVASPSMVYLGDTKSFLGDAKLYGGGGRASGGGAGAGGGEKQIQMAPQQYAAGVGGASGGGGAQEPKAGGTKEESQSLLRVRRTPRRPSCPLLDRAFLRLLLVCVCGNQRADPSSAGRSCWDRSKCVSLHLHHPL